MNFFHPSPLRITKHVRRLKKQIPNSLDPIIIPVRPRRGAILRDCFSDVAAQIAEHGGKIQHGWVVWEWPNVLIEVEFHGVWVSPTGELVDVSPKENNEQQIMFIPDSKRIFKEKPVDNIRLAVGTDYRIKKFIELHKRFYRFKCNAGENASFGEEIKLEGEAVRVWNEAGEIEKQLMEKYFN